MEIPCNAPMLHCLWQISDKTGGSMLFLLSYIHIVLHKNSKRMMYRECILPLSEDF